MIDILADVQGLDVLVKRMKALEQKGQEKVAKAAVRGALNVIAKQMKKDVDSKVKDGRKGIKGKLKSTRKEVTAKVGVGVGQKKKKLRQMQAAMALTRPKSRGGVGIGPNNIHWWVAGTKTRTSRPSVNRGRMPSMQPGLARIAATKAAGKVKAEMIKRGALQLVKEARKLQTIR